VNHDMKALIIKALEEEESIELPEMSDGELSRTNAMALKDMILNNRLASAEFLYSSNSDISYLQLRQDALCLAELGDFRLFYFLISKSPEFFSEDLGNLLNYAINHQNGAVVSCLLSKDLDELDVSFAFSTALEKGKLGVIKHFLSSGRNFDGWHL